MAATVKIPWEEGSGHIVADLSVGKVTLSSDTANEGVEREQVVTFRTTKGSPLCSVSRTVRQAGRRIGLKDKDGAILRDSNGLVLTSII